MSVISTAANYGGRVVDNQQGVKQFYISASQSIASWIYKKKSDGLLVQTPSNQKIPVLINNDLIVTGSIYNSSDKRLKDNIQSIEQETLDDLFTINPIHFIFKNDSIRKKHFGFLAQEVEEKFPDLVQDNVSGFKTVNYVEFVPLILAKIKNMQNEIDELKQTIK